MPRHTPPLPSGTQRILVAGVSGSGKSTLARQLSGALDLPYTEIDSLYHGPNWTPREEFVDDVRAMIAGDTWITEWQYRSVRPMLLERAQVLIWLDFPFWTVTFPRVVRRTVDRRFRRKELWNGNYEQPLWTIFSDKGHIIRWSVRTRHNYHAQFAAVQDEHPDVTVLRFRRPRDVKHWLAQSDTLAR